jgi:hypothetical protein
MMNCHKIRKISIASELDHPSFCIAHKNGKPMDFR